MKKKIFFWKEHKNLSKISISLLMLLISINSAFANFNIEIEENFETTMGGFIIESENNIPNHYTNGCDGFIGEGLCINLTDNNDEKFYMYHENLFIEKGFNYIIDFHTLVSYNESFGSQIYEMTIHNINNLGAISQFNDFNIIYFQLEFMDFGGIIIRMFTNMEYDDDITFFAPQDFLYNTISLTQLNSTHYAVTYDVYGGLSPVSTSLTLPLSDVNTLAFNGLNMAGLGKQRSNVTSLSHNYVIDEFKFISNKPIEEEPEDTTLFFPVSTNNIILLSLITLLIMFLTYFGYKQKIITIVYFGIIISTFVGIILLINEWFFIIGLLYVFYPLLLIFDS
jgi:hypothetical protein